MPKNEFKASVTLLSSRILAKRPMVKINGNVQYLSTGTSMIQAGGKVVGLFENTWMRACGVGKLQEDGSRKINKMGNVELLLDVDEDRGEFDLAVINTIRTAIPEFDTKSLNSFYEELMKITGENGSMVRRGVSSSLGKIAAEDLLLSGALSKDSPFFTKTTVGIAIRQKGIKNYGILEVREELDLNDRPVIVDYPEGSDPDFNNLTDAHLPNNVLSIAIISQASLQSEEKKPDVDLPSSAHLLVQQGLMKAPVQTIEKQLGQSILGLLSAISFSLSKKRIPHVPNAQFSFTATVVSALSKGNDAFTFLCQRPEENSIPSSLVNCITEYVAKHPELKKLAEIECLAFANRVKKQLIAGNISELENEFGQAQESKGTCAMM